MRAMLLREPSSARDGKAALDATEVERPTPRDGEITVRVSVCGVCRTDLDVVEGRVAARRYPIIPGHQAIGRASEVAPDVSTVHVGDRVGVVAQDVGGRVGSRVGEASGTVSGVAAGLVGLAPSAGAALSAQASERSDPLIAEVLLRQCLRKDVVVELRI